MGPAAVDPARHLVLMSAARASVLDELRESGEPVTVADLATALNSHSNTVREHLGALVRLGLVMRAKTAATGRGRPPWTYTAVATEPDLRVREYAALATVLAGQIAHSSVNPKADAIAAGETWGERLAANLAVSGAPAARRSLVDLLGDLGFAPAADRRATTIRLTRCPLIEAARARPDVVCRVHLGLVRGVLAKLGGNPAGAELLPFSEPGVCRLELSPTAHVPLPDGHLGHQVESASPGRGGLPL